jgi:carboxyl-terminal processing protease
MTRYRFLSLEFVAIGVFSATNSPADAATSQPYDVVEQFAEVLSVVEEGYVEPPAREKLAEGAIAGMVSALDPHSAYMTPEQYEEFQQDTSGQFAGIGVEVDLRNGQVVVIAPIAGSPAELAGIRQGDRILMVDGTPLDTLPLTEIVHRMRGAKGTAVNLVIRRNKRQAPISIRVVRDDVKLPSIYARYFDGRIAYLRITTFQEGTHTDLLAKMGALKSQWGPCRGIVLDLRQNPGGLVAESIAVADEFLAKGPLFSTRHRGQVVEQVYTTNYGTFERVPLVTIVDPGTASAAEIVAAAFKDRQRSLLVGDRTFGKGTVQSIIDLPGGAGLRLTSLRYYTPSGAGIQASGIEPNRLVAEQEKTAELQRESDLPGHLPSESRLALAQSVQPAALQVDHGDNPCEVPKPMLSMAQRMDQLPASPVAVSDSALAFAYRTLSEQLREK